MKLSNKSMTGGSPTFGIADAASLSMLRSGCCRPISLYASGKVSQAYALIAQETDGLFQDQLKARRPRAGKSPKSLPDTNSTES